MGGGTTEWIKWWGLKIKDGEEREKASQQIRRTNKYDRLGEGVEDLSGIGTSVIVIGMTKMERGGEETAVTYSDLGVGLQREGGQAGGLFVLGLDRDGILGTNAQSEELA